MGIGEMGHCFYEEMDVEEFVKRKIPSIISKAQRKPQLPKPKPIDETDRRYDLETAKLKINSRFRLE